MKVGDLVRLKSPFEPVTCLIVRSINESTDDFFEVLSAKSCKTYNNKTMWTFYEDELKIVGEKNAI